MDKGGGEEPRFSWEGEDGRGQDPWPGLGSGSGGFKEDKLS